MYRHTHTERQTDGRTETERQRQRETDRETDRDRQTERDCDIFTCKEQRGFKSYQNTYLLPTCGTVNIC